MPELFDLSDLGIPADSEYHKLLARCPDIQLRSFQDGEYLVREADPSQEVLIILRGAYVVERQVREKQDRPGNVLATVISDPDDPSFVGEMAYLGGGFRTASVRSSGCTHAMVLKPAYLGIIIADFPHFTQILCRQFTARLREANELLKDHHERLSMESFTVVKKAGDIVFERGEPADVLYQLIEGQLVRETDTGEHTLSFGQLPQGFVEPGPFFRGGVRESRVRAKTNAMLVGVRSKSLEAVVRCYPELLLRLYKEAAE